MFSFIAKWILSFFTADKVGILFNTLLMNAMTTVGKEIFDKENQKVALDFVRELSKRNDLSNIQKAAVFNKQMLNWAVKIGKKISENSINCLREMAVATLKCEKKENEDDVQRD